MIGAMPETTFEREAIAEFLDQLRAQVGAEVEIVSHPEDDPKDPLTVDAAVRVDDELWAIDHMRLAYEPTVVPAGDEAARKLRLPLEELANQGGCSLAVGVFPPRHDTRTRLEIDSYYSNILAKAEVVVSSGEDWFDLDGFTSVRVLERGSRPDAEAVQIQTWLAESGSIEDQVAAALKAPLAEKLLGQLAVAKRAGYRVMLLIDQVPDPARRQPTLFLASWSTVKIVVDRIMAPYPGVVDSVWFRARDRSFKNLAAVTG
jgi:hypothetical protein